jgi:hypothetical protein
MVATEMGGQFLETLMIGVSGSGARFDATGPFDWDDCFLMSVFIYQSDATGKAAASAVGKPNIGGFDPQNPAQPTWTMQLKAEEPPDNPGANDLTRYLVTGEAFAVAAALVVSSGGVQIVHWGQIITLA